MTHRQIKRFQIRVEFADDSDMIRVKNQYENMQSDMQNYIKIHVV